jgi:hypothetical protein
MTTTQDDGISNLKRSLDVSDTKAEINADELRLAQMGLSHDYCFFSHRSLADS